MNREELLARARAAAKTKVVKVPELGGDVTVRALSASSKFQMVERHEATQKKAEQLKADGKRADTLVLDDNAWLAAQGIIDPDTRAMLFPGEHYKELLEFDEKALDPIIAAVLKLSGMTDEGDEPEPESAKKLSGKTDNAG